MTGYDNNLRGVLFKNDRKEKENQPDYKGSAEVDGVEYWLSAWIKEGQKGKFMSLSFQAKEEQPKPAAKAPVKNGKAGHNRYEDDDIPW